MSENKNFKRSFPLLELDPRPDYLCIEKITEILNKESTLTWIFYGTYEELEFLLKNKYLNPNANLTNGMKPLHLLSASKDEKAVELFLNYGADVNSKDNLGETPIFSLLQVLHIPTLKILIEHGADLNAKSSINQPFWIHAHKIGNIEFNHKIHEYSKNNKLYQ